MSKPETPFKDLFAPMEKYGLSGLSPQQMGMYASQPERMAKSAIELQMAQRNVGQEPTPLKKIFTETMRPVGHGLMGVLETLDNVGQDWAFSIIDDVMDGETDWNKIYSRAKANFTGAEDTDFAEILDHMPDTMKKDLSYAMGSTIELGKKGINKGVSSWKSMDRSKPPHVGMAARPAASYTWDDVRQIYGLPGDMVLDLGNLAGIGALKLRNAAKVSRALGKFDNAAKLKMAAGIAMDPLQSGIEGLATGARAVGRQAMKNDNINNFARSTFVHGTGIKEIDDDLAQIGGRRGFVETEVVDRARKMMDAVKPLAKKYDGGRKIYTLAEERVFKPIVKDPDGGITLLAPDLREGFNLKAATKLLDRIEGLQNGNPAAAQSLLADFKNFNNPENVKWWIKNYDPAEREQVIKALTEMRGTVDTWQTMRQAGGMKTPEMYAGLIKDHEWAEKAMAVAYNKARIRATKELKAKNRALTALIKGKEQTARQLVGPKVFREVSAAYQAAPDVEALRKGFKDAYKRRLTSFLEKIEDNDMTALEDLQKLFVGGKLTAEGEQQLVEKLATKAGFRNLVRKHEDLGQAIEMGPAYLPHIVTSEAARALAKHTPGKAGLRNARYDPGIASDMIRKFVDNNGRPLSMEEATKVMANRQLSSITSAPAGGIRSAKDVDEIFPSVIFKDEHVGGKIRRVFGKGDERELAEFFDTDPALVFAIQAQRTAKSITAGEFVKSLADHGFIKAEIPELAKDLPPLLGGKVPRVRAGEPNKSWVPISSVKHLEHMVEKFPELSNHYVTKRMATHIARVADPYFGGLAPHPVIRAYDLSKRWGISYMLPLFPATWNRNSLGNVMQMAYGGMFGNPLKFHNDIYQMFRGNAGQLHMMRGNLQKASKLKVNIKALGARNETTFPEVAKIALKNGVINADYYGSEVKDIISLSDPWKNWKHYTPGHTEFGLVKGGRQVMKYLDNGSRMTLFIHYLEDGYRPAEAAALVKKYMGNFIQETLTPFERNIMTRVFPFYRWTRYNLPLTFDQILFSPQSRYKLAGLRRLHEGAFEPEQERDVGGRVRNWVPSYLEEVGGIHVGYDKKTGEEKFMALEGYIPAADIGNWLGGYDVAKWALSQLTPPLQAGIEIGVKHGIFGGNKFEGQREMFGKQFPALTVHMLRKLRFLTELDRLDPFGNFHREGHGGRKLAPLEERLAKALLGTGIYTVKPMKHIIAKQEEVIEKMRKDIGFLRSPSYRQDLGDWHDPRQNKSETLRHVENYEDAERQENGYPVDTTRINQEPIEKMRDYFHQ